MSKFQSSLKSYLKPGRLADVLTLIQVLAYDQSARRTTEGLRKQLFREPSTAETWIDLGKEHPEFFRVLDPEGNPEKKESVALLARFVLPTTTVPGEAPRTPVLATDVVNNLMSMAIELHDREVQHRDRWKTVLVPTIVAIIAASASVTAAVISTTLKSPPTTQPAQQTIPADRPSPAGH